MTIIKIIVILLSFQRLCTLSCFEKEAWVNSLYHMILYHRFRVIGVMGESFRGLKFLIPRVFWVRKFCKLICLGRNFFEYSKQTEDSW